MTIIVFLIVIRLLKDKFNAIKDFSELHYFVCFFNESIDFF